MGTMCGIDPGLGDGFVAGALWKVIRAFEFGMEDVYPASFHAPMIINEKGTLFRCEFGRVVFRVRTRGCICRRYRF